MFLSGFLNIIIVVILFFFFFWFCYGILQVRNGCYVGLGNSLAVDFVTLELKIWFILVGILV